MFRLPRLLSACSRLVARPVLAVTSPPTASSTPHRRLLASDAGKVNLTFRFPDGSERKLSVKKGDNLLDVVLDHDVDIDGFGACEGTLACSTCHLILPKEVFDGVSDEISDEEMDMLDLAFGVEDTSRLGCQCLVTEQYEGKVIKVPEGVNDQR